jgi:hypothetical protein
MAEAASSASSSRSNSIPFAHARIIIFMRAPSVVSMCLAVWVVGCPEPPRDAATAPHPSTSASSTASASRDDSHTGALAKIGGRCGTVGASLCPAGYHCMDDPADDCDPRKGTCPGSCQAIACGPKSSCASGFECVDDRADSCKPDEGHEGCAGVCVEGAALTRCGGVSGRNCPSGYHCIDDVSDTCNPKLNPTCPGLCVK